jgi:hypothetical protein
MKISFQTSLKLSKSFNLKMNKIKNSELRIEIKSSFQFIFYLLNCRNLTNHECLMGNLKPIVKAKVTISKQQYNNHPIKVII